MPPYVPKKTDNLGSVRQTAQKGLIITIPTRILSNKRQYFLSTGVLEDTMMPRFGCRTQVRLELAMAQPR